MAVGVGFPSYIDGATIALVTGTAAASYPVSNLNDILKAKNPFRSSASAAQAFTYVLAAAESTQFVALVNHNLPTGSTMRVRLFSDNNPDPVGNPGAIVYDSGTINVWTSGSPSTGFSTCRPIVLSAAVSARSGYINVTPASGIVEIGALEVAGWWDWPGIAPGVELGLMQDEDFLGLAGGADDPGINSNTPRVANGEISYLALGTAVNTALDFQKTNGKQRPFVFVVDSTTGSSWARQCYLAVNADVPPLAGKLYRHDTFQFRFREYWR